MNRDPAAAQLAANREGAGGAPFAPAGAGVVVGGLDEAGVQSLRDAAESAERDLATARSELAKMTAAVEVAEEEAMTARAERDHALIRAEQLEGEMAGALVVAGELNGAGQLTKTGFARLVAAAPESAREAAVRRRGGAPLPTPTNADRAAAAVALASPTAQPTTDGDAFSFSTSLGGGGGGGSLTSPGKRVIEGYLRELRDLKELVAAKEAESAEKEAKLAEAREDLERDEAIFAENMREIKTLEGRRVTPPRNARNRSDDTGTRCRRSWRRTPPRTRARFRNDPRRYPLAGDAPAHARDEGGGDGSSFGRGSSASDAEWATPSALGAEGSSRRRRWRWRPPPRRATRRRRRRRNA